MKFFRKKTKKTVEYKSFLYKTYQSYADPLYCSWLSDKAFCEVDGMYAECHPENFYKDGRYLQYSLAYHAAHLDSGGDFIECGVCTGKSIDIFASVLDEYNPLKRTVFGFDSFQGLSEPVSEDKNLPGNKSFFKKGAICGGSREQIIKNLEHHKTRIELVEGWIPKTFEKYLDKQFIFAHVDVDLYEPTFDSLSFIYPRMVRGGIILFDDYGFPMCEGARLAVDKYLNDKKEKLIPVPTGQSILIKL